MTTMETIDTPDQTERQSRRRPFSSWMKKLANFKPGSSTVLDGHQSSSKKRSGYPLKSHSKKSAFSKNVNPSSESTGVNGNLAPESVNQSTSTLPSTSLSTSSLDQENSGVLSEDGMSPPTIENKPTTVTSTGRANSVVAPSHAPSSGQVTNGTIGYGQRGNDSTFSSPAPSIRSLTTTLTTLHSAVPATTTGNNSSINPVTIQFSHQFPSSSPLNALPPHLAPQGNLGHPSTYNSATANNLLTDNASILTLASSSKHRRRRSMDTDASVRALAPSSLFGGSRESLPLSVLSANIESNTHQQRPSIGGMNERGSMYSVAGVAAPALSGERNSCYTGKQSMAADGASIGTSTLQGSHLASPRELNAPGPGKLSHNEIIRDEETETETEETNPVLKNQLSATNEIRKNET